MKYSILIFFIFLYMLSSVSCSSSDSELVLNRSEYKDKLRGFWLGACIANWTSLPTENQRIDFPFFTDLDFGNDKFDYVLDQDPWGADDDTDIEYIYQHAIEKFNNYKLTGLQISQAWKNHIGLPKLWVSNLAALGQMQNGSIPPETSLPENNPMWNMIDAQLTTEIFGALSPGRPDIALDISNLPIRTTAFLHSKWAAEFYVIMHSMSVLVDDTLSTKEQVFWLAEQARKRIPEWSYIADMYDFVKEEYYLNSDKDDWELTRDRVAKRYQYELNAGYKYNYPWDSGINFAASMVSLFYGEGDYKKTIRIGSMCGWDSDNPTSTWGGLLGLLYGFDELQTHFNKSNFSDNYNIERSRFNLPIPLDNFTSMAERGIRIIDNIVVDEMNGFIENDNWMIPLKNSTIKKDDIKETKVPWVIIEDNDNRWKYKNFETKKNQWNASGATLTYGYNNCEAEINFEGTAIQLFSYKSFKGGKIKILLDGENFGEFSLENYFNEKGQYFIKIFEKLNLQPKRHTLKIICDSEATEKTIDMISIIP